MTQLRLPRARALARRDPAQHEAIRLQPVCAVRHGHLVRRLAQPLEETPAVALEVERLVDAIVPQVIVQLTYDLGARGERAPVVRVDVVDVHGDVLARGAGPLRAERAMGALRAEPDHAVTELDHRVVDPAVRAHAPRS